MTAFIDGDCAGSAAVNLEVSALTVPQVLTSSQFAMSLSFSKSIMVEVLQSSYARTHSGRFGGDRG